MNKLLFLFFYLLYSSVAFAAIDECKTDVYFANGILTDEGNATANTLLLELSIKSLYGTTSEMKKHIGKVAKAYNHTSGQVTDLLESVAQKLEGNPLSNDLLSLLDKLATLLTMTAHDSDLQLQIEKYKESITSGHKVLAVAHSQGNLFTYEAYRGLDGWMQDYFEAISIASPGHELIKEGTRRISWNNDLVAYLGLYNDFMPNSVRKVNWILQNSPVEHSIGKPDEHYIYKSQFNDTYTNGTYKYKAEEGFFGRFDSNVHAFTFYMGEELRENGGRIILNPLDGKPLSDASARSAIMGAVGDKLAVLQEKPSQWQADTACLVKDKNASVTHIANALDPIEGVYIDNENGKLFSDNEGYVKAECGSEVDRNGDNTIAQIEAQSGVVEVDLTWEHSEVNMDLSFDAGEKDINNVEGVAREHYYIATEEEISAGVYTVSVNGSTSIPFVDNGECGIEREPISIKINTPGDNAIFIVNARSEAELHIGNVAEIHVDETIEITGEGGIVEVLCHNDCHYFEGPLHTYKIVALLSQALAGPISGADINIYDASDDEANATALITGATTEGSTIYTSGLINLNAESVAQLDDERYYVIEIHGGKDVDVNDDKRLDAIPTDNNGSFHALLTGAEIKAKGFKVNILTEIAYQISKPLLANGADTQEIDAILNEVAQRLLQTGVRQDDVIDKQDLYRWIPSTDKEKLLFKYDIWFNPIVQKVYADDDIYEDAQSLVYAPHYETTTFGVLENTTLPTIGQLTYIDNGTKVFSYSIQGTGNEYFSVSDDGNITLSETAVLDYAEQNIYNFTLTAHTDHGDFITGLTLSVIRDETIIIPQSTIDQIKIGTIIPGPDFTKIQSIGLSGHGSTDFTVDSNGDIYIAAGVVPTTYRQRYYDLNVSINNIYSINLHIETTRRIVTSLSLPEISFDTERLNDGSIFFTANGLEGVQSVSMTNPLNPLVLGHCDTPGYAIFLASSHDGNWLYVADNDGGIQVLDVSNPDKPVIAGSLQIPGYVTHLTLSADGKELFAINDALGVLIVNVSNPYAPQMIKIVNLFTAPFQSAVSSDGTTLYVTDETGVKIVDISNRSTPKIIGQHSIGKWDGGRALTLSRDEKRLYVSEDFGDELFIFDLSHSNSLLLLGSVSVGRIDEMTLSKDSTKLFASATFDDYQIVDISNPCAPRLIETVNIPNAKGLALFENEAFAVVAGYKDGVFVVHLEGMDIEPKGPGVLPLETFVWKDASVGSVVGRLTTCNKSDEKITSWLLYGSDSEYFNVDSDGFITLAKSLLSVDMSMLRFGARAINDIGVGDANVTFNMHTVPALQNLSMILPYNTKANTFVGQIPMVLDDETSISAIVIEGEGAEAFHIDNNGSIFTVSENFVQVSEYDFNVTAYNRFGAGVPALIQIMVDHSVGSFHFEENWDMELTPDERYLYTASGGYGVIAYDISDPTSPLLIGWNEFNASSNIFDITLNADASVMFIADNEFGLRVADINSSVVPVILGSIALPDAIAVRLSPDGDLAYVTTEREGLSIVDVSDYSNPQLMSSIGLKSSYNFWSENLEISDDGSIVYVYDGTGRKLHMIDVTNPLNPIILASHDFRTDSLVLLDGGIKLLSTSKCEVTLNDFTEPSVPVAEILFSHATDCLNKVWLSKNRISGFAYGYEALYLLNMSQKNIAGKLLFNGQYIEKMLFMDNNSKAISLSYDGFTIFDLQGL